MKYAVTITRTTGTPLEETFFESLPQATSYFEHLTQNAAFERVLIILSEKPSPFEEKMLDVHFKDGISYNIPKVGLVKNAPADIPVSARSLDASKPE